MNSMLVLIPNCSASVETLNFLRQGPPMMIDHDMADDMNSLEPLTFSVLEYHDESLLIRLYISGRKTVFDALEDMIVSNDMVDDDRPYVLLPKGWHDYDEYAADCGGFVYDEHTKTARGKYLPPRTDTRDDVYQKAWETALSS